MSIGLIMNDLRNGGVKLYNISVQFMYKWTDPRGGRKIRKIRWYFQDNSDEKSGIEVGRSFIKERREPHHQILASKSINSDISPFLFLMKIDPNLIQSFINRQSIYPLTAKYTLILIHKTIDSHSVSIYRDSDNEIN